MAIVFATDQHNESIPFDDLKKFTFCVVYLARMNNAGNAMIVERHRVKKDGRTCDQIEQMFDDHFSN